MNTFILIVYRCEQVLDTTLNFVVIVEIGGHVFRSITLSLFYHS
jgi:hypothetical protein